MTDWCQITYQYPCNNMNFIVNFLGQLWMAEGTIRMFVMVRLNIHYYFLYYL